MIKMFKNKIHRENLNVKSFNISFSFLFLKLFNCFLLKIFYFTIVLKGKIWHLGMIFLIACFYRSSKRIFMVVEEVIWNLQLLMISIFRNNLKYSINIKLLFIFFLSCYYLITYIKFYVSAWKVKKFHL